MPVFFVNPRLTLFTPPSPLVKSCLTRLFTPLSLVVAFCVFTIPVMKAAETSAFKPVVCEGAYPRHVQGICTNGQDAIYWSWTDALVKTDLEGHIVKQVAAPSHQGDLCFHDGKVYVAVNLGKFNEPAGKADSWVYVYDADSLKLLHQHAVPDLVHGAGGMAYRDGRFILIGGLPPSTPENYVYEYDTDFKLIQRHVLASGYTLMGIQTVEYAEGSWWFGCYGKPQVLLRADANFKLTGRWEFSAAVGMVHIGPHQMLVAENTVSKIATKTPNTARTKLARMDADQGLVWVKDK